MANAVDKVKEVGKDAIDKAKDLVDGDDDDTETFLTQGRLERCKLLIFI